MVQPTGAFEVTKASKPTGRWKAVGGTAGAFTYGYPAGSADSVPLPLPCWAAAPCQTLEIVAGAVQIQRSVTTSGR